MPRRISNRRKATVKKRRNAAPGFIKLDPDYRVRASAGTRRRRKVTVKKRRNTAPAFIKLDP